MTIPIIAFVGNKALWGRVQAVLDLPGTFPAWSRTIKLAAYPRDMDALMGSAARTFGGSIGARRWSRKFSAVSASSSLQLWRKRAMSSSSSREDGHEPTESNRQRDQAQPPRETQPLCKCGRPLRRDCDGNGWLEALGPYSDGSYITSRPCPND